MSNVLNEQTKQQVIALGRLGWSLRRIQKATGVRRETAAAYLREAGIAVRSPGLWGRGSAKPANGVTTDFGGELTTPAAFQGTLPDTDGITAAPADTTTDGGDDPPPAKPAIVVTTDFGGASAAQAPPSSASACASREVASFPVREDSKLQIATSPSGEIWPLSRANVSNGR